MPSTSADRETGGSDPAPRRCRRCGRPLPVAWLEGHCGHCLAVTALGAEDGESASDPTSEGDEPLPRRLGAYELIEVLGRGGMGVVYRARQSSLERDVALKLLPGGEFARPDFRKRFRREALAAARLRHPNIVGIHEVGEHDGIAFYSMELVSGRNLAELLADGPLAPRRAAEYLRAIAGAVRHAHEAGILHRDLKPANVLVDRVTDQPRVTDFGLAKSVRNDAGSDEGSPGDSRPGERLGGADPELTITGQAFGSPSYMPPERTLGAGSGTGPAGDVYSLGAILYHMLTGRPPFEGVGIHDVLLQVRDNDPIPPRRRNARVPIDLETICLECLAKEPSRRYPSAEALAGDLTRFLEGRPILAHPVGTVRRLGLWCRRRPVVAALSAGILSLLVVVAVGASFAVLRVAAARRAEHAERLKTETANAELRETNRRLGETVQLLEMQRIEDLFRAGDSPGAVARLAAVLRRDRSNPIAAARLLSAMAQRPWALPGPTLSHAAGVTVAEFSPDGRQVLGGARDGTATIHDAASGRKIALVRHGGAIVDARYDREGRRFVTASEDGTARVWNATDGVAVTPALGHRGRVNGAEFAPDGRRVLTASADRTAAVWSVEDGAKLREFDTGGAEVEVARFDPDGTVVGTGGADGVVRLFRAGTGEVLWSRREHRGRVLALVFAPDGRRLASAGEDGVSRLWRASDGERVGIPMRHGNVVHGATFHPGGEVLMTTSQDGFVRLWESATGASIGPPLAHEGGVNFGTFGPDGSLFATTGLDHCTRVWNMRDGSPACQPLRQYERVVHAAFDPAGRRLVTASFDRVAQIWHLGGPRRQPLELTHAGPVTSVAFGPRGDRILTGSLDGTARLWDARTGEPIGGGLADAGGIGHADFDSDGGRVVTCSTEGTAAIWRVSDGALLVRLAGHAKAVRHAHFSPDGARLVTASADGTARVWDARTGRATANPFVHGGEVIVARFGPDGRRIATGAEDHAARIWDAVTGELVAGPLRHLDHVLWVAFDRDGGRLVSASGDNTARVWDVSTGTSVGPPLRHRRNVAKAAFLAGGTRVATVSLDTTARIWDAATGEALTEPMKHDAPATQLSASADGERLLTGGWNGRVRLWDTTTGLPTTEWMDAGGAVAAACLDASGTRIAVATANLVRVWDLPRASVPVPEWVPDFAETVAGTRLSPRGDLVLGRRFEAWPWAPGPGTGEADDFYRRFAEEFFAGRAEGEAVPAR